MEPETDESIALGWIEWTKRTHRETGDLRERADLDRASAADEDWAFGRLLDIHSEDPDRALKIAIDISRRSEDAWVLCSLGCGPFEDALADMGQRALGILKVEAAAKDNAWYALEHTWQNAMPDDVWRELQRFLGRVES